MKTYELVIIFNSKNIDFFNNFVPFFKKIIIYNKYIILNVQKWGVLNFYYKIKNNFKGIFLLVRFICDTYFLKKILFFLKNNNFIIRYILLLLNKNNYHLKHLLFKNKKIKKNVSKKNF